jgi:hypothetical protein
MASSTHISEPVLAINSGLPSITPGNPLRTGAGCLARIAAPVLQSAIADVASAAAISAAGIIFGVIFSSFRMNNLRRARKGEKAKSHEQHRNPKDKNGQETPASTRPKGGARSPAGAARGDARTDRCSARSQEPSAPRRPEWQAAFAIARP